MDRKAQHSVHSITKKLGPTEETQHAHTHILERHVNKEFTVKGELSMVNKNMNR